jgi:site-specific recombinase XerD
MKSISYQEYLNKNNYSLSTCRIYQYVVTRFISQYPDAIHADFKGISNYLFQMKEKCNKGFSANMVLSAIKKYYDYLIYSKKIMVNPIKQLSIKSCRINIIGSDLFSPAELDLLLNREERYHLLKLRNQVIVSLLIFQGLSSIEICNIKIKDIQLDLGRIRVRGNCLIIRRILELKPAQTNLLQQYMMESRKELNRFELDNLLLCKTGKPLTVDEINYLLETFKFIFPNKNLNPKKIRQSVIYNWLNFYEIPLEDTQLLAGHKRISATLRYLKPNINQFVLLLSEFCPV